MSAQPKRREREPWALFGSAAALAFAASLPAQTVELDVVALVNEVRASEQWIDEVESLFVRLEGTWTTRPEVIEARRGALRKQHPELDKIDTERFPWLRPLQHETIEIAFDPMRLRSLRDIPGSTYELKIWDGQRTVTLRRGHPKTTPEYSLDDEPHRLGGKSFLIPLSWPRASLHSFWWEPIDAGGLTRSFWGPLEDFKLVGREDYLGIDCFVVENQGGFRRWYVGADDHLLHGFLLRAFSRDADTMPVLREIAERRGQDITSRREYYQWKSTLSPTEKRAVDREYWAGMFPASYPTGEHFMLEYREVAPGWWFPMTHGYQLFAKEKDETGAYPPTSRCELHVVEIKVNEALPDELFSVELQEGGWVNDYRREIDVFYSYEKDMPAEKLEAIIAERRKQLDEWQAKGGFRDTLTGRPAPPFPDTTWLNSEALTWEDLRGWVVILDFWADWCGPCRADMPVMRQWHEKRNATGITVLGIHAPGSRLESIEKIIKRYKLGYPICIDTLAPPGARGLGAFSSWFGVSGIPYAFVIDGEGRVAGHGKLEQVLEIARQLPARNAQAQP